MKTLLRAISIKNLSDKFFGQLVSELSRVNGETYDIAQVMTITLEECGLVVEKVQNTVTLFDNDNRQIVKMWTIQ